MSSLYPELRAEQAVADYIDSHGEELERAGGILPPELLGLIDANDAAFAAKVERLVLLVRTLEAQAAAAQIEADRIRKLGSSRKRRAATIQRNILHAMVETGRDTVETDLCSVRRAKNPVSIRYTGEGGEKIPDRYVKITYAFDAGKAKELWKDLYPEEPGEVQVKGEPITLVRGENLRIK